MLARGAALSLGVVLALALAPSAWAQRMLETTTLPESAEPIKINADHIGTWEQAGHQIFLLRGNVAVYQGETLIQTRSGVAWVDMGAFQKERVFRVVVYGEDGIKLTRQTAGGADYGYVRLSTTNNQIGIKAHLSKLVQEDLSNDQRYRRALANQPEKLSLPGLKAPAKATPIIEQKDERIRQAGATQPAFEVKDGPVNAGVMPASASYFQIPPQTKGEPVPGAANEGVPTAPPIFSPTPLPPPAPDAAPKPAPKISILPRTMGADLNIQYKPVEKNMTAVIITGGVTIRFNAPPGTPAAAAGTLDIEADRVVIWTPGNTQQLFGNARSPQGAEGGAHEIYMSGNVEIRTKSKDSVETLRADEVYLDVRRNVAVARQADLELAKPTLQHPIHLTSPELIRENEKVYKAVHASVFSTILPSDPGLKVDVANVKIEERKTQRKGLFGLFPANDKNGQPIFENEHIFTGRNMVATLEGVPFFYFPYLRGRVEDPFGPLDNINLGYNSVFGAQFETSWDMFDLLGLNRPAGDRWRLYLDYLTRRGPFAGSEYDFSGRNLFGTNAYYSGLVKLYGGYDRSPDIIGGNRGNEVFWPNEFSPIPITHPDWRGWLQAKTNVQDLPHGFTVLGNLNFLSDRNFLEQYYLNTQLNDLNQDTYLNVKQQQENWAWSLMGQIRTRDWLTATDWLPRTDGYLLGQTFGFDRFEDLLVYNAHASAGYARLWPTDLAPFAYEPNDVRRDAARLDLWQELSMPIYLGAVKLAPYLAADLAYYSQDTAGDSRGRLFGAGGVRFNLPLSRLYPDIQSDLLNLNGIYHKINLTGNYQYARVSSSYSNFPQFDRLNDDATDQSLRDIRPVQTRYNPANAAFLTTSELFNPQDYLIRRLIDNNVDTFDDIQVLQFGVRQRWQTRRGFLAADHVVDWMMLNVNASVFPQSNRDNFGHTFGILEYDWTWNIGDRTALTSAGWFEPFEGGPRVFDFGAHYNRPNGTNLYAGYRQVDPLNSKAVVASIVYPMSAKYALTASTVWDFGVNVRNYSLLFTRMGTDVVFNAGVNYNSTINSVGVIFEIVPNLAGRPGRAGGPMQQAMMR